MFKKLLDELLSATTEEQINEILFRNGGTDRKRDGVDIAYQHDRLTWEDHERLFILAGRLSKAIEKGA